MRGLYLIVALVIILASNLYGEVCLQQFSFDLSSVEINSQDRSVSYQGLGKLESPNHPSTPFAQYSFYSDLSGTPADLEIVVISADTIDLGFAVKNSAPDFLTSDYQQDIDQINLISGTDELYPNNNSEIRSSTFKGRLTYNITLYPIQFLDANRIILNRQMELRRADNLTCYLKPGRPTQAVFDRSTVPSQFRSSSLETDGVPLGGNFVIVTSPELVDSFEPFLKLKLNTGFDAAIAITDSIYTRYSGVDDAEALRNYLIDFYQAGGEYVLLGGDEDNVPIRYTYYYNTSSVPDLDKTMLNDLYFADVDGDWDFDGDGIFGEPTQDHPDMAPDLELGRLPFSSGSQVISYTAKLRSYLFNPGSGDASYLGRTIFFTSDQMRDYFDGGQQYKVAENFPPGFTSECELLAEQPDGIAPAPVGPQGTSVTAQLDDGYGMVNILAHGRPDGFVLNSASYNQFPKSYILTGPEQATQINFFELAGSQKVGFYYSISCSQAMFDLDKLYGLTVPAVVEELLAIEDGGPVSMVAFSRWGWVGSSYKLMASFYSHLFDDADGYPVRAMYASWQDYPYYRDQIYSQNYYGDPSIQIYRAVPTAVAIEPASSYQFNDQSVSLNILSAGVPLAEYPINVELDTDQYFSVTSDQNGQAVISLPDGYIGDIIVTAYLPGQISAQVTLSPSIIADADDDDLVIPGEFALRQNWPNPFNPTSTIGFSLTRASFVQMNVYDILGRLVNVLVENNLPAGEHQILFNGHDADNRELPSGIYFYRLISEEGTITRKMTLLK